MPDDVTLFVKVDPSLHRKLSIVAAELGMDKQEIYRYAMIFAAHDPSFKTKLKEAGDKVRTAGR